MANDELRRRKEIDAAAKMGMIPPKSMWSMIGSPDNFLEQGEEFSQYLIEHGALNPDSAVLDIGCGLGKYAIHLAAYLENGIYDGFDVEYPSVEWCQIAITPRLPNTRFRHTPLKSDMYSPSALTTAADFRFPYAEGIYDLVFLASVFTHMFDDDVENYISEISRVLKPGGRCIATMYLLNEKSRAGIAAGTACFGFSIQRGGCWLERLDPPESAVAYDERRLFETMEKYSLFPAEPTRYGCWPERGVQDQDWVIVEKRE